MQRHSRRGSSARPALICGHGWRNPKSESVAKPWREFTRFRLRQGSSLALPAPARMESAGTWGLNKKPRRSQLELFRLTDTGGELCWGQFKSLAPSKGWQNLNHHGRDHCSDKRTAHLAYGGDFHNNFLWAAWAKSHLHFRHLVHIVRTDPSTLHSSIPKPGTGMCAEVWISPLFN